MHEGERDLPARITPGRAGSPGSPPSPPSPPARRQLFHRRAPWAASQSRPQPRDSAPAEGAVEHRFGPPRTPGSAIDGDRRGAPPRRIPQGAHARSDPTVARRRRIRTDLW